MSFSGAIVDYPMHIKNLLDDLELSEDVISVLKKYTPVLTSDSILNDIFYNLGYIESRNLFTRIPSKVEALRLIQNYASMPQSDFSEYFAETWDPVRGIKYEYLKTYYENKLEDLSEAIDLGLSPIDDDNENSLNSLWSTPMKKFAESISTEENTPIKYRGLKLLTSKVKHIIYSKGFFSYKEVSDELVKELEVNEKFDKNKEEKNVFRRVYDALNVLIASEVVVKKGKKYVWRRTLGEENLRLRRKIFKQKEKIIEKKEGLKEAANRLLAVDKLLKRNKMNQDCDVIKFPFIVIVTEENPENSVIMESNLDHTQIAMKFMKKINLFGDIEILQKLNLKSDTKILPNEVQFILNSAS